MRRLSITLIILAILMNFALLFVSAQIIDVSIDGNSTVYMCYPYDYNVTIRNNSVNQSVTNINYVVTLPVGFNTTDPLTYNVLSLGPGLTNKIKIHVNTFCDVEGGNISVNGTYDYNNSQDTLSATKPITLYKGAVTIEKTPSTQNATLEEDVSWTITIKSSGLGPIKNVIITDTLGSGLQYISSSPEGALDAHGTY